MPASTVSDVDSGGNLTGATVTIGAGFLTGDTLNFTNQNGISRQLQCSARGVLTLTGTATVAQLSGGAATRSPSARASDDPTAIGTDTAAPSAGRSTTARAINGIAAHQHAERHGVTWRRPSTAGATATYTGGGAAVVLDAGLTVSDVDSGGS